MALRLPTKSANRWIIGLIVAATAATAATTLYGISWFGRAGGSSISLQSTKSASVAKITTLGRLEPETEVIHLSAPLALEGDRVAQLFVQQGDHVQTGQVIAILDSRDRLHSALQQAQKQVRVTQARLDQVNAGAKDGEIAAQQATIERIRAEWQGDKMTQGAEIARLGAEWQGDRATQQAKIKMLQAELSNAQAEYQRHQQLHQEGAISNSAFDGKYLSVETTHQQLSEARATLSKINATASKQLSEARATLSKINATASKQLTEAKATLSKIAEVRPTDVKAAQTEVDTAIAVMKRAQIELNQAYIRAPMAGQILKIYTRPGEAISEDGIVDLGQTAHMIAIAEVYQTDIAKIRIGQPTVITSQAFSGDVKGTVYEIGLAVSRQNIFSTQPGENLDRRVVEVKIRLSPEESKRVASLTNLQVQVAIEA